MQTLHKFKISSLIRKSTLFLNNKFVIRSKTSSGGILGKRFFASNEINLVLDGNLTFLILLISSIEFLIEYFGEKLV